MSQDRSRTISLPKRLGSFQEVHLGLSRREAVENARIFLEREGAVRGEPCPLTTDYFAVLRPLAKGDVRAAALKLFETNPLPGITSRLVADPYAETQVYNRRADRISLRAIERFLADAVKVDGRSFKDEGRKTIKVAVIGSGPAGLMAAACLTRQGVRVTVVESMPWIGGSLASFYPEFRLPRQVLATAITQLKAQGVVFRTTTLFPRVAGESDFFEEGGCSAILVAGGAGVPGILGIPGEGAAGIFSVENFLRDVRLMNAGRAPFSTPLFLGKKVVVTGHNEMAFDAARTAVRCGGVVTMVVAGAETDIRVASDQVRQAAEEGVRFRSFANPVSFTIGPNGCVKEVVCRHLDYRVDREGRLNVVEDENAVFQLEADTVLTAAPSRANTLFLSEVQGLDFNLDSSVWVNSGSSATSVRKMFAAGQVVRPEMSLMEILVDARRAAQEIIVNMKL